MARFTAPSISGYNSNPPSDDGSQTAANQLTWAKHKDKLADPIKEYVDQVVANVTTGFATVFPNGVTTLSSSTTLTAASHNARTILVTGSSTVTLPEAASAGVNFDAVIVKNEISNSVTIDTQGDETLAGRSSIILGFKGEWIRVATDGSNWFVVGSNLPRIGMPEPYVGSTAPGGRLLLNGDTIGSSASSATHSDDDLEDLFTMYWSGMANSEAPVSGGRGASASADWAANKTLTLPNTRSRAIIGAGAGTFSEDVSAGSVNTTNDTFTVASNTDKWITGMKVQVSTTDTLPTGLSASTDYYVIRDSSTTIKFATSLANAVAGTDIDITAAGTGTHTVTHTFTTRAVGAVGGEETHASTVAETAAHDHEMTLDQKFGSNEGASNGWGKDTGSAGNATESTDSTGGSGAHNNMPPFIAFTWIVRY